MTFLDALRDAGCVAVLRSRSAADAVTTAHVLAEAGVRGIELTFSVPGVLGAVERLRAELPGDVLVGLGTVTRPAQVKDAVAAGSQFLVSPGTDAVLGRALAGSAVPFLAGALTPSEVMAVAAYGPAAVKLFPASAVGPGYLKALRGPFPELAIVPTGGIGTDNAADWMRAGALAVGAGGSLAPADATPESLERARETATALLARIHTVRTSPRPGAPS
ncbi:bifunctional 4-hydroxy-2-oxoglutarate aldolase/2-dehydro-3-deoxy-phosphogluconate aldolase [Streptomyces sp. NPDC020490]|uniref:bifunctional 4-hydroxy-2-oxoglutarate aldolase/2-dehydro-3-deoxy-phosphogluconate aldolase n=1 Tax=Streptomyces sp. NPDC020490 TaxID=3365078 RepID=UPI0037A95E76